MDEIAPSLCRPRADLACFRCCPPIRPAGYDHADWRGSLRRLLVENTAAFKTGAALADPRSITGFFCWGLGFLDGSGRLIGCLLHPARHGGDDLRRLTGYGEKCRRETCPEAEVFAGRGPAVRKALLDLAATGDSFAFSSPAANPLWRLLSWGEALDPLGRALADSAHPWTRHLAAARAGWRAHLLARLSPPDGPDFDPVAFEAEAEDLRRSLLPRQSRPLADGLPLPALGLGRGLAAFLGRGLGIGRLAPDELPELLARLEAGLEEAGRRLRRSGRVLVP